MTPTAKIPILILLLCCGTFLLKSQPIDEKSSQFISDARYYHVDDQYNFGPNLNGLGLDAGYRFYHKRNYQILQYTGSLGVGAAWSSGIISTTVFFDPMDVYFGIQLNRNGNNPVYLGPYLGATYQYHFYTETNGGYTSWFTLYDIGVQLLAEIQFKDHKLLIDFANSLFGAASRPDAERDPDNSQKFSDIAANAVSNLSTGSFNLLNETRLNVDYTFGKIREYKIGYEFTYLGYFEAPAFDFMSHAFVFKMNLRRKR